jgi:hypothetical protein
MKGELDIVFNACQAARPHPRRWRTQLTMAHNAGSA